MDTGDGFYWIALIEQFRTRPPGAAPVYYALSGALLLGLALVSRWRAGVDLRKSLVATARLLVASLLILTPGLPWYFLMALPMTALLGWSAPFAMCSVAFWLYDFNYDFAGDAPKFFVRWSVAVGVGAAAALADALRTPGKGVRS